MATAWITGSSPVMTAAGVPAAFDQQKLGCHARNNWLAHPVRMGTD